MSNQNRARNVVLRSLAALAVGSVVAGTAYYCAYANMRDAFSYRWDELATRHELDLLQKAVEERRRATGRLPADLAALKAGEGERPFRVDPQGRVVDVWERPYQYRVEGDTFALSSFGKDGQPGGEGLNADIHPTSTGRPLELPTFRQFAFELPTEGVQVTCLLAGVCAGLICLRSSRHSGVGFLALVGATALGAVLVAVVISALHVPSGH
jgi:hypothetical protein